MRILYHHRTLADGAEGIHIAAMVDAFRALGHDVRLMGVAPGSPASRSRTVERVRSVLPRAAFEAASVGVNTLEYVEVWREIGRFRPDLLYTRHARYATAALAASRRAGIPSVLEVNALFAARGYEQFEPLALKRLAMRFERHALEYATVALAVSSPLATQIRQVARARVVVVPNGVDPDRFDPCHADGARIRAQYGLGDAITIGWSGILRDWHGLDLLLETMPSLPAARLLVIGDGPARPALETRVTQLGLQQRVVITGRVAHDAMPDYLAATDIAVVADERTGVASPMKLLEYMAMARPVVAPDTENIRNLIGHDIDGLLFASRDVDDLVCQLRRLAGSAGLRQRLGSGARSKVLAERSWRHVAATILRAVFRPSP
jgi:glycosyltransferase involved in cell wall biosynthesis